MFFAKPLAGRVILKPETAQATDKLGLFIPGMAREKPTRGEIMAVSAGMLAADGSRIKPEVEVGNQVLFAKHTGTEIADGDEVYLLMHEKDIFAII